MNIAAFSITFFWSMLAVSAGEPVRVSLRTLVNEPTTYHNQLVVVEGLWRFGFENSVIADPADDTRSIWVDADEQDIESPRDPNLMLLQQLRRMRGKSGEVLAVSLGGASVVLEAEFVEWKSTPEVRKQIGELKAGETLIGGFGHLGSYPFRLQVKRVLWFRVQVEGGTIPKDRPNCSATTRCSRGELLGSGF